MNVKMSGVMMGVGEVGFLGFRRWQAAEWQ